MISKYSFTKRWVEPGMAGSVYLLYDAMRAVYDERPELKTQSLVDWQYRMSTYLTSRMRCEVLAYCDGEVVGATSLGINDDIHVGATLEVLATFIDKDHRSTAVIKGFLRMSESIARSLGLKTLSVTKYQGPYRYSLRYIPIS